MTYKFSKGVLARNLNNIGVPYNKAYKFAESIEPEASKYDCLDKIREIIINNLDPEIAEKYKLYLDFKETEKVILIGGGTGVGTSSLSIELANRLNIFRVVGSDSIREVLRNIIPIQISPELHSSTYEAWKYLNLGDIKIKNKEIIGFRKSSLPVITGINAVLNRSMKENISIIIEGIHILPDLFDKKILENKQVYFLFLGVTDIDEHKKRFYLRQQSSSRKAKKYLENFESIRKIHDYILEQAKKYGFPIIYTKNIKYNAKKAVNILLNEFKKRKNSIQ